MSLCQHHQDLRVATWFRIDAHTSGISCTVVLSSCSNTLLGVISTFQFGKVGVGIYGSEED